ncbi:MAG TPA: pyridoxamine 5'-phosphate oxidase family protein [Roseiflexaceae bacterium]|nr:pyridoxamine 5'-phosphate oxidase family protein [Roseiflexaceae bacterium]
MNSDELVSIANLIRGQRVAALGTLREAYPFASMVAYAAEPDFGGVLLHLSRLAAHTKQLLAAPQSSLLICEPDDGRDDPQTLARITLSGAATPIPAESAAYADARDCYLARLPVSAPLFEFPDFALFRFVPSEARYVGGFGRIYTLTSQHLQRAAEHVE